MGFEWLTILPEVKSEQNIIITRCEIRLEVKDTTQISCDQRKKEAKLVHNDRYDYSQWPDHVSRNTIVQITCKSHNVTFSQRLGLHLSGRTGCPQCVSEKRSNSHQKSKDYFIQIMNEKHSFKYDYSLLPHSITSSSRVEIICPIHGTFTQKVDHHVSGSGCQKCARLASSYGHIPTDSLTKLNNPDWLREQHQDKQKSIITIANELGVGDTYVGRQLHKFNIEIVNHQKSSLEWEMVNFLIQHNIKNIRTNDRSVISPKELDIYLPDYNLAIEMCGLYWHSDLHKSSNYHKDKLERCNQANIRLLTIFEDEWINKQEIVKTKILNILHMSEAPKVFARKTQIVEIGRAEKRDFFDKFHIQGNGPSSINLALKHDDIIVAAMSFIKTKDEYVLNRYATSMLVVGGFSKLLKHFFHQAAPGLDVVTFADLRWSEGDLYKNNNFVVDKILKPDYTYVVNGTTIRQHKFGFRRKFLDKKLPYFDSSLTEKQNCDNNNLLRIWDCGKIKYKYNN